MHLGDLGAADAQAAAAGLVDQLPGAVAGRVLERRAAGALADRLVLLAIVGDLVHLLEDRGRIAGRALVERLREDPVGRHVAVAIGEAHVGQRQRVDLAVRDRRRAPRSARPWFRGHARRRSCAAHRRSSPECRDRTPGRRCRRPPPRARPSRRAPPCRRAMRLPGSGVIVGETRPRRMTTPGTPPSRTSRLEPRPMTVTGRSAGMPARK